MLCWAQVSLGEMDKVTTKYQQIITVSFYASAQAISFILIAQVIYLNFHYLIGASLTIVASLSLFFQNVMSLVQSLYFEGHRLTKTGETLLKVQFYVNSCFTFAYVGFMIWAIVYMYQHSSDPHHDSL